MFTSPQDDHIDRAATLERCFPTAERLVSQTILDLVATGDGGVLVRYEYELKAGGRHRNTEFIRVRDGQLVETQVFFGGPAEAPKPVPGRPVVHFEIIGQYPARLRDFYGSMFGWEFDVPAPVASEVSTAGDYGFVDRVTMDDGTGIRGGIGGGQGYDAHAVFYVAVPNVEAALAQAEHLGGTRRMGPAANPRGDLVVGHLADPEGTVVGVAGPS